MPYRLIYIGLGMVAIAAIALGIAFSTSGEPVDLPGPLEATSRTLLYLLVSPKFCQIWSTLAVRFYI